MAGRRRATGHAPLKHSRWRKRFAQSPDQPSHERVAKGLAFVPQGRMIFSQLTVEENILVGLRNAAQRTVPEYV